MTIQNEIKKISDALDNLPFWENENSFFSTSMYLKEEPQDYSKSSDYFLEKYIGITKKCIKNDKSCFGQNYKKEDGTYYIPDYNGGCAILKSDVSICIKPQIQQEDITGFIDANGKMGPNKIGFDAQPFKIKAKERGFVKSDETSQIELIKP